jgi:hypothetical protein
MAGAGWSIGCSSAVGYGMHPVFGIARNCGRRFSCVLIGPTPPKAPKSNHPWLRRRICNTISARTCVDQIPRHAAPCRRHTDPETCALRNAWHAEWRAAVRGYLARLLMNRHGPIAQTNRARPASRVDPRAPQSPARLVLVHGSFKLSVVVNIPLVSTLNAED